MGGKTILDDLLRELRPRFVPPPRSFQRTRYRPGELAQFDLCEPRSEIPVGWGQTRRGYIVTCELPYSRAFAGTLVFSKEFCDIAFGMSRCLERLGALPGKLVWDREGAIAPRGRPTEQFLAFCGQLALGWVILDAGDCQAKGALERSHRFLHGNFEAGRRFANALDFQNQLDGWSDRINPRVHRTTRAVVAERLAEERAVMRCLPARMPDSDRRSVIRVPAQPYLRVDRNDYSLDPRLVGRRVERTRQPARGDRSGAGHRRARRAPRAGVRRRPLLHRPRPPGRAGAAARRAPPWPRGRRRAPAARAL